MANALFNANEKKEIAEKYVVTAANHPDKAAEMKAYVEERSAATNHDENAVYQAMKAAAELVNNNQPLQEQALTM